MELRHIDIACLSVSPANMRDGRKAPDLTNILSDKTSSSETRIAAARALAANTDLAPKDVVRRSLEIAGEICVYSNQNIVVIEPTA